MRLLVVALVVAALEGCEADRSSSAGTEVTDLLPDKARYALGESVTLTARVRAGAQQEYAGAINLTVFHLDRVVYTERRAARIDAGAASDIKFQWTPPRDDFQGYLAVAEAGSSTATTGVDVSSSPFRYPRYGYVSDFDPGLSAEEIERRVERLSREFLVNMFQLYDWGWRHEKLVETGSDGNVVPIWTDLFGRKIAWSAVTGYVRAMHEYGAAAMAYVMIYAAREGYAERWPISPGSGLFAQPGARDQLHLQLSSDASLWLFDPMNPSWQSWEIADYAQAVNLAGFDGVHIDQLGPRFDVYLADGSPVDLAARFRPFLEQTQRALKLANPERAACTFNLVDGAVDGWATRDVATSEACDFLYSEIWFGANSYDDLRLYAEYLRGLGGGRAVVFAAYSQHGEEVGPVYEAETARLRGVEVASNHSGYTGSGFVTAVDKPDAAVTWTIDLEESQNVSLVFRFANASGRIARRHVSVDGGRAGELSFNASDAWTVWSSSAYISVRLEAGRHDIELSHQPGDDGAVNIDHLSLGIFDEHAVRLADAVLFASGVSHIEIGDDVAGLAHEYYPNRSKSITPALLRAMRHYYTFSAAYESVLFASDVLPIDSKTAPLELLSGQRIDDHGGGVIHAIFRRAPGLEIVHLVNLMGVNDDQWRNVAQAPEEQTNVRVRYRLPKGARATGLFVASPDFQAGRPIALQFTSREVAAEAFVETTIPQLAYWDMLVIRTEPVP
jgi:dextranase